MKSENLSAHDKEFLEAARKIMAKHRELLERIGKL